MLEVGFHRNLLSYVERWDNIIDLIVKDLWVEFRSILSYKT